ncbi:ribonucleotide-diphosphate reductase subunit beta, partial [Acinetobacter baumannii]
RYIQRDEEGTHLDLFAHMLDTLRHENKDVFTQSFWNKALEVFLTSSEMEISWGKYITKGVTNPKAIEDYIKHLANLRAEQIQAPFVPYPGVKN